MAFQSQQSIELMMYLTISCNVKHALFTLMWSLNFIKGMKALKLQEKQFLTFTEIEVSDMKYCSKVQIYTKMYFTFTEV